MTSTLTYLCTFKKGALKTTFKFERTPKGLVCNATEIHIQETGADKIGAVPGLVGIGGGVISGLI